jgi:hypothetical protein
VMLLGCPVEKRWLWPYAERKKERGTRNLYWFLGCRLAKPRKICKRLISVILFWMCNSTVRSVLLKFASDPRRPKWIGKQLSGFDVNWYIFSLLCIDNYAKRLLKKVTDMLNGRW